MKKIASLLECYAKNFRVLQIIGTCFLLNVTGNHLAAAAEGVEFFAVAKFDHYLQTSDLAPQLTRNPFKIELSLEANDDANLSSVEVTLPGNLILDLEKDDDGNWEREYEFSNRIDRDQQFSEGDYVFAVTTTDDGTASSTLRLTEAPFPTAPRVSNYQAAQTIDATAPFTLTWDGFSNADPDDFIVIGIEDPWDSYEEIYESGFLSATTTSLDIPAGMLQPGRVYEVWITFVKAADKDETTFENGTGLAVYGSETKLQIQTISDLGPGTGVENFLLVKLKRFAQHGMLPPQEMPAEDENQGGLFLDATGPNSVLNAAVMWPDGEMYWLNRDHHDETSWEIDEDSFDRDEEDLLPPGTYRFHIETADGLRVIPLQLTEENHPPAPRIANTTAIQSVDSKEPFVLTWDPFPGATADDLVVFEIEDEMSESDENSKLEFLPASTTSFEIPAGFLKPGRTYETSVIFVKVSDRNDTAFTGALGFAGHASGTAVALRTTANPGPGEGIDIYGVFENSLLPPIGPGNLGTRSRKRTV